MADDYEPYDNRLRLTTTNNFATLINLVKGILGTGVLAMPEAFLNSGLLIGSVFTIVLTMIITYCLHILFKGMYAICKRKKVGQINYPDTFKEALLVGPDCLKKLSNSAPYIINAFIVVYQIGVGCIYIIFVCKNVKEVVDANTSKDSEIPLHVYIIIALIPILAITYVKSLKDLAPISIFGNLVTFVGLVIIYYYCYRKIEPLSDRSLFGKYERWPLFIGTVSFSVLSIGVILSVEQNMTKPGSWGGLFGVLNQGMLIVTILNVFTGFSGYWKYGDKTESAITLNLDITEPLSWAVRIAFATALYFSYSLQIYPATEILWEQYVEEYMKTSEHKLFWEYVIRTILVLLTFLLSVAIPRLGLFISLFGAFCLSVIGLIIPPLIDICLHYPDQYGAGKCILIRDIFLLIFGIIAFLTGTYTAIYEMVVSFSQ